MNTNMTFIEIGCKIQKDALTAGQAMKQFEKSCNICCLHGLNIECRNCPIAACHAAIMKQRFGKEVKND